jgi:hypothetical protein
MKFQKRPGLAGLIILSFLTSTIVSCAGVQPPRPKVFLPADSYPNSVTVSGVSVAVIPFDPNRDVYANPHDPNPRRPDFNWYKAGVCPTRLIINNHADRDIIVDPGQITCTDSAGVPYKPYDPREAGDAVVASEAFNSYVRGALAGAVLGAALGAGLGAAIGGASGRRGGAGRGAAFGAAAGGTEGLFLGSVANRSAMERRVRFTLMANSLYPKILGQEMTDDGLIYFPAVNIKSVKVLLPGVGELEPIKMEIPVVMPPQERG